MGAHRGECAHDRRTPVSGRSDAEEGLGIGVGQARERRRAGRTSRQACRGVRQHQQHRPDRQVLDGSQVVGRGRCVRLPLPAGCRDWIVPGARALDQAQRAAELGRRGARRGCRRAGRQRARRTVEPQPGRGGQEQQDGEQDRPWHTRRVPPDANYSNAGSGIPGSGARTPARPSPHHSKENSGRPGVLGTPRTPVLKRARRSENPRCNRDIPGTGADQCPKRNERHPTYAFTKSTTSAKSIMPSAFTSAPSS